MNQASTVIKRLLILSIFLSEKQVITGYYTESNVRFDGACTKILNIELICLMLSEFWGSGFSITKVLL